MHDAVTRTTASVGSWTVGSGTSTRRMSNGAWNSVARIPAVCRTGPGSPEVVTAGLARSGAVPTRRRTDPAAGRRAVEAWRQDPAAADRTTLAAAVRFCLEELAERAPGNSVELRVPPLGVTQCVQGPRHTRGTPPNVVETDATSWLELATGALTWQEAVDTARVRASGLRADLSAWLPLV